MGIALSLPASAATVEVLVRERGNGPIRDQVAVLMPATAPGEMAFAPATRPLTTGADGKVVFESVALGRYVVQIWGRLAPGLIEPAKNPLAPPPQITIAAEGEKLSLEVEVWRGSLLTAEVFVDRAQTLGDTKLVLRGLDGQPDQVIPVRVRTPVVRVLIPGRYEAELQLAPGYLLVDLVWNREQLPGATVRFDVREDTRDQNIGWYLSTPSLITGKISNPDGPCPVQVVATLQEPGPWIGPATQRGGSSFQVVPHQEWVRDQHCVYRLWLPDGRWSVRPLGPDLLTSDPEQADVAIAPGETRSLDFQITTKDGKEESKGQILIVSVRSPSSRPVGGATVEVRKKGEERSTVPLETDTTERYASATFRGLSAGSYRVAAGHEAFLEGTAAVEGFDPKAKEPVRVTVTLEEGATVHARARDEAERAVQGVELSCERVDPLPEMALTDEAIVANKRVATDLSDVTGHSEIRGRYSGTHTVQGRMTGEQSATRFVLVKQEGTKPAKSIELDLTEGQRTDVDLVVLPAASLSGRLVCSDRGTMPAKVSFRIFPADKPIEGLWKDTKLKAGAAHAPDDVILEGDGRDAFLLGPLEKGEYRLASRPHGQDYWSWASREIMPERAHLFPVTELATGETGLVEIECGPVVAIVPEARSKEPMPDLKLGTVRATLRRARDANAKPSGREVEVHADRAFLRGLSEGEYLAAATVSHPYLIPPTVALPERPMKLVRGKLEDIRVPFERVGGRIEVRGAAKFARLVPLNTDATVLPLTDGLADFQGTLPGTYRVELCGDPECAAVSRVWANVVVRAATTTRLPSAP